jgi:hypothetical protein
MHKMAYGIDLVRLKIDIPITDKKQINNTHPTTICPFRLIRRAGLIMRGRIIHKGLGLVVNVFQIAPALPRERKSKYALAE